MLTGKEKRIWEEQVNREPTEQKNLPFEMARSNKNQKKKSKKRNKAEKIV